MIGIIVRFTVGVLVSFFLTSLLWSSLIFTRANAFISDPLITSDDSLVYSMVNNSIQDAVEAGIDMNRIRDELAQKLERAPVALTDIESSDTLTAHRVLLNQGKPAIRLDHVNGRITKTFFIPMSDKRHVITIGPMNSRPPISRAMLVLFMLGTTVIASITGWIIAGPTMRMMGSMEKVANQIIRGNISARVATQTKSQRFIPKDIRKMIHCFNHMADHNQQLLEKQQSLLHAVAHELRTPTARMRFRLDLLAMAQTDSQREEKLEELDGDVSEIDQFIEELIAFNRLDSGDSLKREAVSVEEVFKAEKEAIFHIVGPRQIELKDPDNAVVFADKRLFARVLRNLMSNGIRHCEKGICITCERNHGKIVIHVDDDGAGVPESQRKLIFEPFQRLDASRNKKSGGVGLGLAIVRRVVDLHEASVEVQQAPQPYGGARFTMVWPRGVISPKSRTPTKALGGISPIQDAPIVPPASPESSEPRAS